MIRDAAHRYARKLVFFGESRDKIVGDAEKAAIEEALIFWRGNKSRAAKWLKMHRNTMGRLIVHYKIVAPPLQIKKGRRLVSVDHRGVR